jgi:hypothetical protein
VNIFPFHFHCTYLYNFHFWDLFFLSSFVVVLFNFNSLHVTLSHVCCFFFNLELFCNFHYILFHFLPFLCHYCHGIKLLHHILLHKDAQGLGLNCWKNSDAIWGGVTRFLGMGYALWWDLCWQEANYRSIGSYISSTCTFLNCKFWGL